MLMRPICDAMYLARDMSVVKPLEWLFIFQQVQTHRTDKAINFIIHNLTRCRSVLILSQQNSKFVMNYGQKFPPHLNNIAALPCEVLIIIMLM